MTAEKFLKNEGLEVDCDYPDLETVAKLMEVYAKQKVSEALEKELKKENADTTYKLVARSIKTNKQTNRRIYSSKKTFDRFAPATASRYARTYGIAELYKVVNGEWELISRQTCDKPEIK